LAFALQGTGNVDVYFSPKGGVTAAIVDEIDRASKKISVQAYSFTSKPIANALIKAKKRGVSVTVIVDGDKSRGKHKSWSFFKKHDTRERFDPATLFKNSGVLVYADKKHEIAHNKVMIMDNKTLITGSFNFTKQAEVENAENLLIFKDNPALVEKYVRNFNEHLDHSEKQ
jgi:phosphatidylserine/phosphatidylglycerophosphate/cardiolipin synthase-like enzyme